MSDRSRQTRRRFLATGVAAAAAGLAGCSSIPGVGDDGLEAGMEWSIADFRGSGPMVESRPTPSGTSIQDLPELSGELDVYLGGGEGGLYVQLVELLQQIYPDFNARLRTDSSSALANQIITEAEGGQSPADVFVSVDAGSLGVVADAGVTTQLPDSILDPVPADFRAETGEWVGIAGRARTIPFNTNQLAAGDVPNDVSALPEFAADHTMGWAPTYGAFQSFVTAMRLLEGEDATRGWLQDMQDAGVEEYRDEWYTSNAVADGSIAAGFANHYYALRVTAARQDPPIDLAFTENDAGALVNVSGAEIVESSDQQDLAATFLRHLLSAEAQEFFATRTFAYPMIPGVQPVGGLPTIDDLNPPDLDLTALSDLQPTLELMRDVGVL